MLYSHYDDLKAIKLSVLTNNNSIPIRYTGSGNKDRHAAYYWNVSRAEDVLAGDPS